MPLISFEKVLKIISTILSILSAAFNAFTSSNGYEPIDSFKDDKIDNED